MPVTFEELASMISERDKISYAEAMSAVRDCVAEIEMAFMNGDLDEAEDALRYNLGLLPDYLDIFVF